MHRLEAYTRLALIFIVIIGILCSPIFVVCKKRGKSLFRPVGYIGLFCALFLIVFATILFMPITFSPEKYLNLNPLLWMQNAGGFETFLNEKIPNVILFIPLGFFIPIVFKNMRRLYKTALLSFVLTFSVEFCQYFIGRSSDIDDVITNLLGGIIGYVVYVLFDKLLVSMRFWNELKGDNI